MLWTMIKNNLKLMFRSKLIIVLVVISPILVMAALSNAFGELLQSDYELENIKIGYYTQTNSKLDMFLNDSSKTLEDEQIILEKHGLDDGKTLVSNGSIDAFVYEEDEQVKVFSLREDSIPTEMCQYIVSQFYTECGNLGAKDIVSIKGKKIESLKLSSAGNYYGIIETVYFLFCGMLFLTSVVQSERKNRISQRFVAAPTNPVLIYLSKLIPCAIMVVLETAISMVFAAIMFDTNWGNFPVTLGIIGLAILAACAYGITCLYLVKNLAVSVILLFSTVWTWGFLGGSFETYMFSAIPEKIKCFSPLYYVNRTLVEFSTMGKSDYAIRCVIVLIGMFAVFSLFGSLLMKRRMGEE